MTDRKHNCPMRPNVWCSRSKNDGACCRETPDHAVGFGVIPRDSKTGHWDIISGGKRVFRIRGEFPSWVVYDERVMTVDKEKPASSYRSVSAALLWCADELMRVRKPQ